MRLSIPAVAIVAALLAAPVQAAGQEPVKSFDQLNARLKVGDTVWVTNAQGREIKGEIQSLAPDALTLEVDGARTFTAHDVRVIHERKRDSLKNGALIGGSIFGGLVLSRASPPQGATTPPRARGLPPSTAPSAQPSARASMPPSRARSWSCIERLALRARRATRACRSRP